MDIDVALREALALAEAALKGEPGVSPAEALDELAAALVDIDEWLTKGGMMPQRWWQARPFAVKGFA